MAVLLKQRRPTSPVPTDRDHEFLTEWLPVHDEDLTTWRHWFTHCRVRHVVKVQYLTRDGHTGPHYMIYTHRIKLNASGRASEWCCEA